MLMDVTEKSSFSPAYKQMSSNHPLRYLFLEKGYVTDNLQFMYYSEVNSDLKYDALHFNGTVLVVGIYQHWKVVA